MAAAHAKDVETQGKYEVKYMRYWVDDNARKAWSKRRTRRPRRAFIARLTAWADEIHEVQQGE